MFRNYILFITIYHYSVCNIHNRDVGIYSSFFNCITGFFNYISNYINVDGSEIYVIAAIYIRLVPALADVANSR